MTEMVHWFDENIQLPTTVPLVDRNGNSVRIEQNLNLHYMVSYIEDGRNKYMVADEGAVRYFFNKWGVRAIGF
jgi:hypothetical protein